MVVAVEDVRDVVENERRGWVTALLLTRDDVAALLVTACCDAVSGGSDCAVALDVAGAASLSHTLMNNKHHSERCMWFTWVWELVCCLVLVAASGLVLVSVLASVLVLESALNSKTFFKKTIQMFETNIYSIKTK